MTIARTMLNITNTERTDQNQRPPDRAEITNLHPRGLTAYHYLRLEQMENMTRNPNTAQETHDNLAYDDKFIKFRDALKKTFDLDAISEEEFEAEMNEFLALDFSHKSHFMDGEPNLEEWLEIRHLYSERQTIENSIMHS